MYRIGLGHDTHRLIEGRPLIIGGVEIPHYSGPDSHSDGDVLLHALTDALLGALALGDIGELFPDDEPAHAGVPGDVSGRHRRHGRKPADSAAAEHAKNRTFLRMGVRAGQTGRQ